jgi:hypothetical protein
VIQTGRQADKGTGARGLFSSPRENLPVFARRVTFQASSGKICLAKGALKLSPSSQWNSRNLFQHFQSCLYR